MSGQHDFTPKRLENANLTSQDKAAESMSAWVKSLEHLMASLDAAPIATEKKEEILQHMQLIRKELTEGRWPETALGDVAVQVAHELGEFEQIAQEWQGFSIRLAQWVKTVSDALGVK